MFFKKLFSNNLFLLFLILLTSFLIKNPFYTPTFLGYFGSYQAGMGMLAFEFSKSNFTHWLYPTLFELINGLPALEMTFYPIAALVAGLLWKVFGGSLDFWGCFQAIIFSAFSTLFIYLCARRMASRWFALSAAFLFAFSPMSLIYGRAFMNESAALVFISISIFHLLIWKDNKNIFYLLLSSLFFAGTIIFRLHFIILMPAFLYIIWKEGKARNWIDGLSFLTAVFFLAGFWFIHTYQATLNLKSIHTSIFMQVEARHFPDPLLFQLDFYIKILKEFIFRLWGVIPFVLMMMGIKRTFHKDMFWIPLTFVVFLIALILSPQKFYDHPFYLLPLLVPGVFAAAFGLERLITNAKTLFQKYFVSLIIVLTVLSNVALFWRPAFTESRDKSALLKAVDFVHNYSADQDRVIAAHGGSADLLYYLRRHGNSLQLFSGARELDKYMRRIKYSHLTFSEYEERNRAFLDSIAWFEYLKKKGNIQYFVIIPRSDLEKDKRFKKYLEDTYRLLSPPEEGYAVYKLS